MFISQLAIKFLLVLAIYFATPLLLLVGLSRLGHLLELSPVYVYIAGCVSGIVLVPILVYILKIAARFLFVQKDETDHALYRLDHGILNIDMPPKTLWMNMGYWKDTSDFPAACCALLDELLVSAGILGREGVPPTDLSNDTPLKLVDLGFGCGDQSIYLTQQMKRTSRRNVDKVDHQPRRIFDAYIGMTISRPQYEFACSRLYSNHDLDKTKFRLYCADAATPQFWSKDIHEVMKNPQTEQGVEFATSSPKYTTWVLALDTLYHFIPSRELIFSYAFKELHASIMAFDLLLSDKPSIWDLVLLRIVSRFTGTPFSNFLTVAQYKSQLVAAGYDSSKIDIRDISEHVFSGIASFIERRDGELKIIGLGAGRYKVAGKVFKWWARTGIIRGCIVIARR